MKSIFDTNDIKDIADKIHIGRGKQDKFGMELYNLFVKAKQEGIEELTVDQLTVAYYRFYVQNKKDGKKKTTIQIMNKLWALASKNKFNIKKVEGKKGRYYLDEDV